jgi:hypothetical protein
MASGTKHRAPSPPAPPDAGAGVLIGCDRVSTEDQKLDLQRDALGQLGGHRVFEDRASGARADRPTGGHPFPPSAWRHPRCLASRSPCPNYPPAGQFAGTVREPGRAAAYGGSAADPGRDCLSPWSWTNHALPRAWPITGCCDRYRFGQSVGRARTRRQAWRGRGYY